jgi:hypothetical protein
MGMREDSIVKIAGKFGKTGMFVKHRHMHVPMSYGIFLESSNVFIISAKTKFSMSRPH